MAFNATTTGDARHAAATAGGRSSSPEARRRIIADTGAILDAVQDELDAQLPPLASIRRASLSAAAEAGDAIVVTVQIKDGNDDNVAEATTVLFSLELDNGLVGDAGFTMAETGAGAEVSTTGKSRLLVTTSAAGAAQVTLTDVATGQAADLFLFAEVIPAVGAVGVKSVLAVSFAA